jgi:hypothetical protein
MSEDQLTYWWLSFAGDEGNRGCCIVQASDFLTAVVRTHQLGINPGGEVQGISTPDCPEVQAEIARWGLDRLVTREEMAAVGGYVNSDGEDLQ